jgi:CspA family cold shock protein
VAAFDDHVGLGTVAGVDGRSYPFHCTQIADGTRTIAEGAEVDFAVVAAHGGRWEAIEVRRR